MAGSKSGGGKSGGDGGRIGRDARTGQYIPAREAERRPATTVTEPRSKPGKK